MAFVLSAVSGALVASSAYYGLSNLLQTRTNQHRKDLAVICDRLIEPPPPSSLTPPASARIVRHDFSTLLKNRWNDAVASTFSLARDETMRVNAWTRTLFYGGDAERSKGGPDSKP